MQFQFNIPFLQYRRFPSLLPQNKSQKKQRTFYSCYPSVGACYEAACGGSLSSGPWISFIVDGVFLNLRCQT